MTTEHSTYIYDSGAEETVTLSRGPATPHGHALLKIAYSDGEVADCYVDLAWLRDRADQLADTPHPLTPDAIEVALRDCMPGVALYRLSGTQVMRLAEDMHAALTEPPKRPEGAEELETVIGLNAGKWTNGAEDVRALADLLASKGVRATEAE